MERERKMYGVLCMPTACWIQPSYGETTENEDTWKKWNILKTTLHLVFQFSGMTVQKYVNHLAAQK